MTKPQPASTRRLIILPEAERLVVLHKMHKPVSRYAIEGDHTRLIWTRAKGSRNND